jgi:hypothetical protein
MATTTTVSRLRKQRHASDYDAAYIALSHYCWGVILRPDLLSDKRRCAEVAHRADPTRLDSFRLAPTEMVKLFKELNYDGSA